MKFFKLYIIPIAIFIIGVIQFNLTKLDNLNNWKLGGYGMYSTYHPTNNYIWLCVDGERIDSKKHKILEKNEDYKKLLNVCYYYPNKRNLKKIHSLIKEKQQDIQSLAIEVWRPNYNPETKELNRKLLNSYAD